MFHFVSFVLSSNLGRIANAYGAACVQSVGGVPTDDSRYIVMTS